MPFPIDSRSVHDILTEKFHALLDECNLVIDSTANNISFQRVYRAGGKN